MHLPNNEHIVRFRGLPDEHVEKKVQSNGAPETQEHGSRANGSNEAAPRNGHVAKANEVHIPLPDNQAPDAVLNTVLSAWTILIQRYQREVFHQFTWGVKGAGNDSIQRILTSGLDLTNQTAARSLMKKIGDVRSKDIILDESTIFLNDGTIEEVHEPLCVNARMTTDRR
jgi:hypothetical protein